MNEEKKLNLIVPHFHYRLMQTKDGKVKLQGSILTDNGSFVWMDIPAAKEEDDNGKPAQTN